MMGGTAVFTELSLLDYFGVKNKPIPQAIVFVYIWSSMIVVYLNFALPKAINNAKDIALKEAIGKKSHTYGITFLQQSYRWHFSKR